MSVAARAGKQPQQTSNAALVSEPSILRWVEPALIAAAASAVLITLGTALLPSQLLTGLGALGLMLTVVGVAWVCRTNRRRSIEAHLISRASVNIGYRLTVRSTRWSVRGWPGQLRRITVTHPAGLSASRGDMTPTAVVQAVQTALPEQQTAVLRGHRRRRHEVTLGLVAAVPSEEKNPIDQQRDRVMSIVADTLGPTAATVASIDDDGDEVTGFVVAIASKGARLTNPNTQRRLIQAIISRLDGQWRHSLDLERDQIQFRRRRPLPVKIDRPVTPVTPDIAEMIPEAIDEDGTIHYWDVAGVMAHHLRAGRTRTGKTVAMIGDVIEASRRGWQVFVLDPKRIEFLGLRSWPNVALVATSVEDQVALVNYLDSVMNERYRQIEQEGASKADFHRILFVIDEYRQFYGISKAWWDVTKPQGMPTCPAIEQIGGLLRMAAAARIHVLLATQRPDAAFLGGETRDNFSSRSATGRLGQDGAEMMFDNAHAGSTIPRHIQGRGTIVGLDDRPKEVQFFYTPDPYQARGAEQDLLERLRPEQTTWPRLTVEYPSTEEVAATLEPSPSRKPSLEWERVRAARLVPATDVLDNPTPRETDSPPAAGDTRPDPGQECDTTVHTDDDRQLNAEAEDSGDGDDYGPATLVPVASLEVGDLIDIDGQWMTITAPPLNDTEGTVVSWRDDFDTTGEFIGDSQELIEARHPICD